MKQTQLDEPQTLRITNLLVQKYKYDDVKTDLTSVRVVRATERSGLRVAATLPHGALAHSSLQPFSQRQTLINYKTFSI